MNTLTLFERMTFSNFERMKFYEKDRSFTVIKFDKRCDINYLETLKLYCTIHDIKIDLMSKELLSCADVLADYASTSGPRYFYFWVDKD